MYNFSSKSSYTKSTDAACAPAFSSAFNMHFISDTAVCAVSLFIISIIIRLQVVLGRLIRVKNNACMKSIPVC